MRTVRAAAQLVHQRKLRERDLAPVGQPGRHVPHGLLDGVTGGPQAPDDPLRLAVDRQEVSRRGVEDRNTEGRGVDQCLEAGSRPLFIAVGARVGDGRPCLRGEERQHLFILLRVLPSVLLLAEEQETHVHAPVTDGRALQGPVGHGVGAEPI